MTDQHSAEGQTGDQATRDLTVSRTIEASPNRVYDAFIDPDELAQWLHPPGVSAEIHHLEPEAGGTYRISMVGETGPAHTYGGTYLELVPGERIVQTESPETDDPAMGGEVTVTITFEDGPDGTEVTVGMEVPPDWPDDGIAGWAAALDNLAALLDSGR